MTRPWHRRSARNASSLVGALVALLLACGCDGPGDPSAGEAPADVLETIATAGDLRLRVALQPANATVGEPLTLTVELVAPEGADVRMPELDTEVGDFHVRDARTPPDVPEPGGRRWLHTYRIDTGGEAGLHRHE